jgi:hypothetical protein
MSKRIGIVSYNINCNFTNYGSALQSWALSEKRKKTPQPLEAAQDTADPGLLPDDAALARTDGLHIHKLVHGLPEPQREVFMLRTLGQLSFRDIGELFGKTDSIPTKRICILSAAALAALVAFRIAPNSQAMYQWSEKIIPAIHLSWAYLVIPLLWITSRIRRKF